MSTHDNKNPPSPALPAPWAAIRTILPKLCCACGLLLGAIPAHAQTLSELLDKALASDPAYLGARTGIDLADARKRQALGALLPQVSASANTNDNRRDYQTRSSTQPSGNDRYNNHNAQITLTQPLWRYANIVGWQQASSVAAQAEHQLSGAEQDLFARLAGAWFELLAARDALHYAERQAQAAQRYWETARRGAELGTHSAPQAEEARARLDQAGADRLTAEAELQMKLAALEQIAGAGISAPAAALRDEAQAPPLSPSTLDEWLNAADTQNPAILAAQKAVDAAGDEVRKQRAGHQPSLDLVASYGKNSQAVGGFPGQAGYDINTGSVGLQLNIPLYSGGTQSGKVAEAIAQQEKARLDLEAARRNARFAAKQAWYVWHAAASRVRAGRQALQAAQAALAVARKGEEGGLKTEFDRLQAEQQWFAAQRDYGKARYDQITAQVRLKAAAGQLAGADVRGIDAMFAGDAAR